MEIINWSDAFVNNIVNEVFRLPKVKVLAVGKEKFEFYKYVLTHEFNIQEAEVYTKIVKRDGIEIIRLYVIEFYCDEKIKHDIPRYLYLKEKNGYLME